MYIAGITEMLSSDIWRLSEIVFLELREFLYKAHLTLTRLQQSLIGPKSVQYTLAIRVPGLDTLIGCLPLLAKPSGTPWY